ncbi:MAG: CDP-alcohol phosphatidyltransferase family protein [Anaerolineae bacterium]|nr:CDP-alcohol phosphatidyltransferase family protein [Anaerolineae bacterium]
MIANMITLSRIPLLALIIFLLYQPTASTQFIAVPLIVVLILMDTLDGVVARKLGETSLLGSVLDIAADRAVELALWIVFADLNMIPVVIPLLVMARGTFVDAFRSVAPSKGLTPFELMRSRLGRFLVKSPWLRTPYGVVKAVAFVLLAWAQGLQTAAHPAFATIFTCSQTAAWLAFMFCVLRGLPVLIEAPGVLMAEDSK